MKQLRRTVYTMHSETYKMDLTPETIERVKQLTRRPWLEDIEIGEITEQDIINGFNGDYDYANDHRMCAIADAVFELMWDCDYNDEYLDIDDREPFEDEVIDVPELDWSYRDR